MPVLSRKDFLKLLAGAGLGLGITLSGLDRVSFLLNNDKAGSSQRRSGFFREASAAAAGFWENPGTSYNTNITAIHAALLNNGKIIIVAGSSFDKSWPPNDDFHGQPNPSTVVYKASIYDPAPNAQNRNVSLPNTNEDLFCCHHAQLPNGNILFAGGTLMYEESLQPENCNGIWRGIKKTYVYNVGQNTLTTPSGSDMQEGRWYPTLLTLPDGRVASFSGYDYKGSENRLIQIFNPGNNQWEHAPKHSPTNGTTYQPNSGGCEPPNGTSYSPSTWSIVPGSVLGEYPRMHLMPSGLVAVVGSTTQVRLWNPSTTTISGMAGGEWRNLSPNVTSRSWGGSFLLPLENSLSERGTIVVFGGNGPVANTPTEVLKFNTDSVSYTKLTSGIAGMNNNRRYPLPVILPDGKCVVFGGTTGGQSAGYIKTPEYFTFNPQNNTGTWTNLAVANADRTYHSTALLLPDGRVWTASGTPSSNGNGTKQVEFYHPWYMDGEVRPVITDVPNASIGGYGESLTIITPDVDDVPTTHGVSLIKLGSSTHHFEPNQRFIWLNITSKNIAASSMQVAMPLNRNLAPEGYYMIHILNNHNPNVPSEGKIIRIPGTAVPDQTTPSLTITSPSAAQVFSGTASGFTINVSGSTSDNIPNGVSSVTLIGPNGQSIIAPVTSGSWSASVSTGSSSPGTVQRTIKATATDLSGNSSSVTIPITIVFT